MTGRIGDQWGIGDIDHGTGQSDITLVYPSNIIYAAEWNVIINAINRTLQHQGSAAIIPALVHIDDLVTAYASIDTGSTAAYNGSGTTGIAKVNTPYSTTYSGEWGSSGSRTIEFNQTLTFSSGDAARYFFNAGGTVSLSFSHSGGSPVTNVTDSNSQWDAFATACGTMVFGYKNTTKTGGSGSTSVLLNSNNGGYWNSIGSNVVHFKQFDTVLTSNYIQVEYWWTGTSAHGGSPILHFRTTWANVTGSLPNIVNGNSVVSLTVNAPATTYLTNTWGTPVFAGTAPAFPTAGTSLGTYCVGYNQWEATADGSGGVTTTQIVTNSPTCGYIPPPTGVVLGLTQPANYTNELSWSTVAGASSYNLYRGTAGSGSETLYVTSASNPYSDSGLSSSTTYYYYVKPVGGTPPAEGGASNEVSGTPTAPTPAPSAPTLSSVTPASTQNTLVWTSVAGATSYNIYRSTSSGTETLLLSVGSTSYVDTGLTNGTTYYYKVSAVGPGGESALSNELSGTPVAPGGPPSPPASISCIAGYSQNTITWSASAGATSYNLYRSTSSGTETLYVTGATSSYVDTGLTPGTTYYYYVKAVNGFGEGSASSEVFGTPTAAPSVPGPVSSSLVATPGAGSVSLSWGAASGATSYTLYRSTSSGTESSYVTGIGTTSYVDSSVTAWTPYYYKVAGVNGAGTGPQSNEASATPTSGSTTPTATLAGSGTVYVFNNSAGTMTYYSTEPYYLNPPNVTLGEWVTTSADLGRQTGVWVKGNPSTSPNYNFTIQVFSSESTAIIGTGPQTINVSTSTLGFNILPFVGYGNMGYARSWYSEDYLMALDFVSLSVSGSHAYLTLSLRYEYITSSTPGTPPTKDSPGTPGVNTYGDVYLAVPLEFTRLW